MSVRFTYLWLICGGLLVSTPLVAMSSSGASTTGIAAEATGGKAPDASGDTGVSGEPDGKAARFKFVPLKPAESKDGARPDGKVADTASAKTDGTGTTPKDPDDDDDDDIKEPLYGRFGSYYALDGQRRYQNEFSSRATEIMEILRQLPRQTRRIERSIRGLEAQKSATSDPVAIERYENRIKAYRECLVMLENSIAKQDAIGVAIARGLAGNEWKAIQDQPISSIPAGMFVGGALLVSTKCGNSLGRRIADAMDRVIGGTWDWGVNGLINAWHALVGLVFPDAAKPFEFKTLGIWQDFIKIMFNDIDKFLKDGLKDSLRGKDSTLRKVDDATVDDAQTMNVWRMLIDGYARQIDFFVSTIDQNLAAAQGAWVVEPNVIFFAQELRRRLLEFQSIITKPKSLKEFDALIDSNKSLITGYRCNIESLLQRLIASIEQPVTTTESPSPNGKIGRMSSRAALDDDDNKLPGSFLGR